MTTIAAITRVAATSMGKLPLSIAWLITAPRASGRSDKSCDQIRKDSRQQKLSPSFGAAELVHVTDFLQVGGDRTRACDHVEEDVPLGSEQAIRA